LIVSTNVTERNKYLLTDTVFIRRLGLPKTPFLLVDLNSIRSTIDDFFVGYKRS
jgi:hypothetical protein